MKYINLLRKICLALAAVWGMLLIMLLIMVMFFDYSPHIFKNSFEIWESIVYGGYIVIGPFIYIYLFFKFIVPYFMEIHKSNKEDVLGSNKSQDRLPNLF